MKPAAALFVLALAAPAAAQAPAPPIEVKYTQFTLPNGLHVILHEDHSVPIVDGEHVVPRRLGERTPGRTGFAHLFEHLMFMGSGHAPYGEFDSQLESRRRREQRIDRQRPDQLLHRRAVQRARARAVPRIRPHGLPARRDDAEDGRRAARRREERTAAELREPARTAWPTSRLNEMLYPEGHPYHWPVIGYMPDLTAASYEDVVDVLQDVLRAVERQPRGRRRHRSGADAAARREVVQRREAGPARPSR